MVDKVIAEIEKYNMIPPGSRVIAAVSGGSDSMSMLFVLNKLKETLGFSLEAAHVNHLLRGDDADRDENFVRETCRELDIPFHLLRADVAGIAREKGKSLEEAGREARYEFFASFGENVIIATAHNLSDRTETFLFNFSRGSTLRGLCSIPPVRGNIIRPLLNCTKKEIEEFCEKEGIRFVTDNSNTDIKYSRNRIRHQVIPELKKINSGLEGCAARCMDSLREDEIFLSELASGLAEKAKTENGYDAGVISAAPVPVKRRALIMIAENAAGVTPEYDAAARMESILTGGACEINGGVRVRVRRGVLEFPGQEETVPAETVLEDSAVFGGYSFTAEVIYKKETNNLQKLSKEILEYRLDCDKISGKLMIRGRTAGDKIKLFPSGCTKSLKKLFSEKGIPPEKRDAYPVIADDNGVILIPGMGFDEKVKITDETKKILRIKITG